MLTLRPLMTKRPLASRHLDRPQTWKRMSLKPGMHVLCSAIICLVSHVDSVMGSMYGEAVLHPVVSQLTQGGISGACKVHPIAVLCQVL